MEKGGHFSPPENIVGNQAVCACVAGEGGAMGNTREGERVGNGGKGRKSPHFYCLRKWAWLEGQKDIAHRPMLKRCTNTVPLDLD